MPATSLQPRRHSGVALVLLRCYALFAPLAGPRSSVSGYSALSRRTSDRQPPDDGLAGHAYWLRSATTLPVKWMAARVLIGTAQGAKSVLHQLPDGRHQFKRAGADESCAQLEFQSTVCILPVHQVAVSTGCRPRWRLRRPAACQWQVIRRVFSWSCYP